MIEPEDIGILMKSVGSVMREYVGAAIAAVTGRVAELETAIRAIPAGPKGEDGKPGESIKGDPGKDGTDGAPGKDGESIVGSPGKDGRDGIDGKPGIDGKDGRDGIDGKSGIDGLPGKDGRDGTDGTPGEKGLDGKDGTPGSDGKDGIDGKDGTAGINGKDGASGNHGEKGLDGKDGRDGREGKDGRDGEPGRDALQIEILPMVEEGKAYPRGTFAKHKGGLIRAVRNTGPFVMAELEKSGWEVIVEGIQSVVVAQGSSLRSFTFECIRTSGYAHVQTFQIPALLYRGIFKDGTEYERGDTATYSGSTWHCNAEHTKAKPGTSEDWQLIVRKGNDGKDGQRGNDGGQGPQGAPGRDLTQMGPDGKKW